MTKQEIALAIKRAGPGADAVDIHHALAEMRREAGDDRPVRFDDFRVALRRLMHGA